MIEWLLVIAATVAFSGYWAYGFDVTDNILLSLTHPAGVIALGAACVLVHVIGSYQVIRYPVATPTSTRCTCLHI